MPTVMGPVTDRLITLFRGIPALVGVAVEDANSVSDKAWPDGVIVGDDGDPDSDVQSTFTQQWANMTHTYRSEIGEIPCAVIAQSGSTDIRARRARVTEIMNLCEEVIVSEPELGGLVFTVEVIAGATKPVQNLRGSAIIAPFTVRYWAHI